MSLVIKDCMCRVCGHHRHSTNGLGTKLTELCMCKSPCTVFTRSVGRSGRGQSIAHRRVPRVLSTPPVGEGGGSAAHERGLARADEGRPGSRLEATRPLAPWVPPRHILGGWDGAGWVGFGPTGSRIGATRGYARLAKTASHSVYRPGNFSTLSARGGQAARLTLVQKEASRSRPPHPARPRPAQPYPLRTPTILIAGIIAESIEPVES